MPEPNAWLPVLPLKNAVLYSSLLDLYKLLGHEWFHEDRARIEEALQQTIAELAMPAASH